MSHIKTLINWIAKHALYLVLIQVIIAILGSLYFSEILQYAPCVLCWWQRIVIYPEAVILIVAILRKDTGVYLYILPLAIIGWIVSIYHNLLTYGILPESVAPCTLGVSCTTKYINWYGFITIQLLSFLALSIIIMLMFLYRWYIKSNKTQ